MRIDPDTCRDADLLAAEVRRLQAVIAAESQKTVTKNKKLLPDQRPVGSMAKLIIERNDKGVYWYYESYSHHRVCEPQRKAQGLRRVEWNDLAGECEIQSGTYMVVPIVEV